MRLSVAIIIFNEERIIEKTLLALSDFADEIVLVDSGSTDNTLSIVKKFNVKLFHQEWLGYPKQKNLAISKCTCDWILSLDADEVLTPELKREIIENISTPLDFVGFKIPRNFYLGEKLIKYGGYYPDYQLRLFKKNSNAFFGERNVHESIELNGKIKYLKNPLNHYAYVNIDDYKVTLEKYASLASKEISVKYFFPRVRAAFSFFYRYFLRLGFLNGEIGFKLACAYSNYVFKKYSLASMNSNYV